MCCLCSTLLVAKWLKAHKSSSQRWSWNRSEFYTFPSSCLRPVGPPSPSQEEGDQYGRCDVDAAWTISTPTIWRSLGRVGSGNLRPKVQRWRHRYWGVHRITSHRENTTVCGKPEANKQADMRIALLIAVLPEGHNSLHWESVLEHRKSTN